MTEQWANVLNFVGYYQASSLGRIKSLARLRKAGYGIGVQRVRERIKKIRIYDGSYPSVDLNKDGRQTTHSVHVLVWEAFNGQIPPGYEVNHKNGVKSDNRLKNLELLTHRENMMHAIRSGLWIPNPNPAKGERNGSAKLTVEDVLAIRVEYNGEFGGFAAIARRYGVTPELISSIIKRKIWKHV